MKNKVLVIVILCLSERFLCSQANTADNTNCTQSPPKNFAVYVFKNDWLLAREIHGLELFWDPVTDWCGGSGHYLFVCGDDVPQYRPGSFNTTKIEIPDYVIKTQNVSFIVNCSIRSVSVSGLMSNWSTPVSVNLHQVNPAPSLMTATYDDQTFQADAIFAKLHISYTPIQYMSEWNKHQHGNCSTWPMIQDYACCYPKRGMVLRPVHKKSMLIKEADLRFPNVSCDSVDQVYDFCLDWLGWKTYEIRECTFNKEEFCIYAIDNTQTWVKVAPMYHTRNRLSRILCNPFKQRVFWTELSSSGLEIMMSEKDASPTPLARKCPCAKRVRVSSPSITLDWSTFHSSRRHPGILAITDNVVWQIILPSSTYSTCKCEQLLDMGFHHFNPPQTAVDWVNFYWLSNGKIFSRNLESKQTEDVTSRIPSTHGKVIQLQSCNAEMRVFAPEKCYYPDFNIRMNMIHPTAGNVELALTYDKSTECQEISKPPNTIKVFHSYSSFKGQCQKSNALISECMLNFDLRNRKLNPKFGISELQKNQSYFVEVWYQPFHHFSTDDNQILYPYGPNPYGYEPNLYRRQGWAQKADSFNTFYNPEKTVPAAIFAGSIAGLVVLLLSVVFIMKVAYSQKWKKFKDIPRASHRDLKPVCKLGCGHFGDIKHETFKGKSVATKYLKDSAGDYEERCFLEEIHTLWICQGTQIVKIIAVCFSKRPYRYIMELANGGSLEQHLRMKRDGSFMREDLCLLHKFIQDINKACLWLAHRNIIHRDLAARNCLIYSGAGHDKDHEVRLADFGLAKDIGYPGGYYEIPESSRNQRALPTASMAPESSLIGIFSLATEVWGFGILMWEILSVGDIPYAGMSPRDIHAHIRKGHRLSKPALALDPIYELMKLCWNFEENKRPNFTELRDCLKNQSLIGAGALCVQFNENKGTKSDSGSLKDVHLEPAYVSEIDQKCIIATKL